jgi:subtilisin family serine protease
MKTLNKNILKNFLSLTAAVSLITSVGHTQESSTNIEKMITESWGIKNVGASVVFDLDPKQTYRLQGRKNQDIHLMAPVQGKKVRVAVIDTGVDMDSLFLQGRISYKQSECEALQKYEQCVTENGKGGCSDMLSTEAEGVDQDKNGYPMDCHGWSILADPTVQNVIGSPSFGDDIGHGTHVAGVIASISKNIEIVPIQVIGSAPNQPIKPFSIDLSPSEDVRGGISADPYLSEMIARGIIYAIHAKVDVINLSIGWPQGQDTEIMRAAIEEAQKQGIIIVAAAGNDSTTALLRPCQYKNVICVAAHKPDGSLASFSNYGFGVDIAAPGVSIISAIPAYNRSVRLPGFIGVDILSGTSQASPFVAGVVAEMLSRGIKSEEIYPRLILGARPIEKELPALVGPIQTAGIPTVSKEPYTKYILSGLMDMTNSMNVKAQPLVLNANKEIQVIKWDRATDKLHFDFPIKNFWAPIKGQKVEVKVAFKEPMSILPTIENVQLTSLVGSDNNNFAMQEEKVVGVDLRITDAKDPADSQLPSDLLFTVQVLVDGKLHRTFDMRAEVSVEIAKDYKANGVTSIPISGKLERGMKKFIVDEIYDNNQDARDYFALVQNETSFSISLMKYENGKYNITPAKEVPFGENIKKTQPYSRIRIDIDGDGKSEYVLGLQEFKDAGGMFNLGDYTMHFYIFDDQMKLKKHAAFYDNRALISLDFTWMKVGKELRPAWIALGKKVVKKYDVTDLWQTNEDETPKLGEDDIRLYYLDENYKLATVDSVDGSKIVDILQPRIENVKQGILPVLLAKNLGTETKPSYLNNFSIGWVTAGKLAETKTALKMSTTMNYRNLVDTKKDKSVSLSQTSDEFLGTFWFGFDAHQKQRVTMVDYKTNSLVDMMLSDERSLFDAPLRVRAAYSSATKKGVFLITNTEIEYHDLIDSSVARSSLNKYTFFGDDLIVDLQFPVSIAQKNGKDKIPALFTTEGSGLSKGVRFLIPTKIGNGKNYKMISPARLRLTSPQGCKATDAPVYINGGYNMDYDCGDQMLRFKLVY